MPWFKCAVCAEKDKRVADLTAQLQAQVDLTRYIVSPHYSQAVTRQADAALSGTTMEIPAENPTTLNEIELQATQMLSGSYS